METNVIHCGDCLKVLKTIPDNSIDLIYLDPPFFSQKEYENFWIKDKASKLKFSDSQWNKLRNSINPTILKEYEAIEARWKGGHKGIYVFVAYMRERLEQCWRILKDTGSIYLHCDWHAGHYLKVMMDEIFGYNNFVNEVIWTYKTQGASKRRWARKHDVLLFYAKSGKYNFNCLTERSYMQHKYGFKDDKLKIDKEGKQYRDALMRDVWEISALQSATKEKLGYPTQKPEALLERIVKASSNEGDIVLDPFCGCGTTIAVANRLKRKWIGVDISRTACNVMKKRIGGKIRIIGGETEKELRTMEPHEFARLIIVEKMLGTINPKKSGDMGIDGWVDFRTIPVQVKRWGHKVGRPEVDKFKYQIERDHKEKGIIVGFEFSRDAYNEVERIRSEFNIDIKLKTVKEIFKEK